ncbi:hypothetical protein CK203_027852 [Vitis vinifera]|uniref:Uncharacterized protein n=1 Tax=Vitis vinifera TaxID=29760 RepID=A0A438J3F8_VITVI|nr:hypothetical protein CK203_027852 [Vitis vinifera]
MEKYWEVIDKRWEGQLHRHLHATGRERDVDSHRKGKASRTISSSSSSDDGDNRGNRRGGGTSGGNRGVGGTSEGTGGYGSTGGGYVSQVDPACHGHKEVKITMPHKIQIMDIDQDMGTTKAFGKTNYISQR